MTICIFPTYSRKYHIRQIFCILALQDYQTIKKSNKMKLEWQVNTEKILTLSFWGGQYWKKILIPSFWGGQYWKNIDLLTQKYFLDFGQEKIILTYFARFSENIVSCTRIWVALVTPTLKVIVVPNLRYLVTPTKIAYPYSNSDTS